MEIALKILPVICTPVGIIGLLAILILIAIIVHDTVKNKEARDVLIVLFVFVGCIAMMLSAILLLIRIGFILFDN